MIDTGLKETQFLINKLKNHPREIMNYHPKYNENIKMKKKEKYNFLEKNSKIYDFYHKLNYIPSVLPKNYVLKNYSSIILPIQNISKKTKMNNKKSTKLNDGPLDLDKFLIEN